MAKDRQGERKTGQKIDREEDRVGEDRQIGS
jgi:hypothetical protein